MLSNRYFLALCSFLIGGGIGLADEPPPLATDVYVTVRRDGSSQKAVANATVTLDYATSEQQHRMTGADGVAAFVIPVDASLVAVRVSHPTLGNLELPYVHWRRDGHRADTVAVLRDRPPYLVTIRTQICEGILRMSCREAEGTLFLYRKGLPDPVTSLPLARNGLRVPLPFPVGELEAVVVTAPDSAVTFFSEIPVQHVFGEPQLDLIVWGGRR